MIQRLETLYYQCLRHTEQDQWEGLATNHLMIEWQKVISIPLPYGPLESYRGLALR